jgi:hypothetical protein
MSKPLHGKPLEFMTPEEKVAMLRIIHQIIRESTPKIVPKHDDPGAVFDPVVPAGTRQLIEFLERRKRQ